MGTAIREICEESASAGMRAQGRDGTSVEENGRRKGKARMETPGRQNALYRRGRYGYAGAADTVWETCDKGASARMRAGERRRFLRRAGAEGKTTWKRRAGKARYSPGHHVQQFGFDRRCGTCKKGVMAGAHVGEMARPLSGMDGGKGRPAWKRRAGKVHYIRRGEARPCGRGRRSAGESSTKAHRQG